MNNQIDLKTKQAEKRQAQHNPKARAALGHLLSYPVLRRSPDLLHSAVPRCHILFIRRQPDQPRVRFSRQLYKAREEQRVQARRR